MVRTSEADDKVTCEDCGSARVNPTDDTPDICATCRVRRSVED